MLYNPVMKFVTSIVFLSLVTVCTTTAQTDSQKSNSVEVETNLLILDENGEYASDVKQSEIKILEGDVEQKITSFVKLDGAVDLAIVADNTGSVRYQLDDIITVGKILVANLRQRDNAQVIRFTNSARIEIIQEWTNKKVALDDALDNMYVDGGQSAVLDALYLASQDMKTRHAREPNRRYAIVLISDGEDRASYYKEKDLYKLLSDSPIQIFTITLTKDLPKSFWTQGENQKTVGWVVKFVNRLAAGTGGTSFILRDKSTKDDLLNALKALLTELRSQFVIKYTSKDVTKETNVRKLTATVVDSDGDKRKVYIKDTIVMVPPKQ